ncbi:amidohydrolase family protein [Sphingomonas sp. MMS24-J13]|uniref:amidohydrolase family protein n=1 Tax=Sphingomonas sp. MMS24-J13 TaxID=3238686 RepID=UPI00384ADA43
MTELKTGGAQGYLRIATEEAFVTQEALDMYGEILDGPDPDPGFKSLWGFYLRSEAERPKFIRDALLGLGAGRIKDMDDRGIDKAVLALTSPGTQILSKDKAVALARNSNDELHQACKDHPDRLIGMAACAPQDPEGAAKEIERAVTKLGMKAVIINSHTHGHYLDEPQFAPILEAAEALDVPIYIHPNTLPRGQVEPLIAAGIDGAIFGFGVETGMHALRVIVSGTLDKFPKLQVIIGHMGEALPFWMYRLDFMHQAGVRAGRYASSGPLKKEFVSNYLKENFIITNSGVAWEPAIKFTQDVIGKDRVMYAMDYPYQCPAYEVEALDNMDMSLDDKKAFFQTNAERVFKL